MPLYFFHSQTDIRMTDPEGTDLPGPKEARAAAIAMCGLMMHDAPDMFWGSRPWQVTVTDASGLILWEIFMNGVSSASGLE